MIIHLIRKPLIENTISTNVQIHHCGGINIDVCRVPTNENITTHTRNVKNKIYGDYAPMIEHKNPGQLLGRFPTNVILQHIPVYLGDLAKFYLKVPE